MRWQTKEAGIPVMLTGHAKAMAKRALMACVLALLACAPALARTGTALRLPPEAGTAPIANVGTASASGLARSPQPADQEARVSTPQILLILLALLALALPVIWGVSNQARARRRAESRLRAIAHSLPGTIYVLRRTPQGVTSFDFLSNNAGKLFGMDREQMLRDSGSTRAVVLKEDLRPLLAAIARSARELSDYEIDFRIRKQDGSIRWLRSSAIPQREPNGDIVWNGYWSDITETKDYETSCRDAMRRLDHAHSVASLGDWSCNLATGELTWSSQIYEMSGRDPALGPPTLEEAVAMFDDGARITADAFFLAQETRKRQSFELSTTKPNGDRLTIHMIVLPDFDANGAVVGMHGTAQDISARKDLEDRLFRAKERADNANLAKSDFLATMSHEIRTPLNGMLGVLELISLMPLKPDLASALEGVRDSGRALHMIIDDILDLSKVEAGKLEIRPEPTSITEVAAAVHRTFAGSASSHGLELRYQVDPRISPAVMVDALRLRQILGNFVSNAIKFTPSGHVELRAHLLEHKDGRESLCFEVEDTGIGISPERQERLFEPFEQAEMSVASRLGGTGLGLSISRRLARLMGGDVAMSSAPQQGTTMRLNIDVTVTDPALLPPSQQTETPTLPRPDAHVPDVEQAALDRSLVLVVDDHPVNLMVMRRQLNTLGYALEEATSGADAFSQWESGRHALVLTDCNMPGMSGYDLARSIRREEAMRGLGRIPIIACSANVMRGVQDECREAGMDDYISKPTELLQLATIMDRWLPRHARAATPSPSPASTPPPAQADTPHTPAGGSTAGRKRILEHFRRVNEADVAQLLQAVDARDMAATAHLAHRIKGACGFIGANDLAAACAALEQAGHADDGTAIPDLMDRFRSELERLDAYLDAEQRR